MGKKKIRSSPERNEKETMKYKNVSFSTVLKCCNSICWWKDHVCLFPLHCASLASQTEQKCEEIDKQPSLTSALLETQLMLSSQWLSLRSSVVSLLMPSWGCSSVSPGSTTMEAVKGKPSMMSLNGESERQRCSVAKARDCCVGRCFEILHARCLNT